MSDLAVETSDLRKVYRSRKGDSVAVDALSLRVPTGGVHGFLGPNGSGKTTTIRMMLGLARPTSGRIRLFGESVPDRLAAVMPRVGAIVESPKFFPTFTGHKNLSLLAGAIDVPTGRVDEVLHEVGLGERGKDRYKAYSLGMKQRLAIAATLLKRPQLLILDEPTNGLDPAGIREIRESIRRLADNGVTVILSSHILAEVQQVCDHVSIIGRGRLLASGSVDEVVGEAGRGVRVRLADLQSGATLLSARGYQLRRDDDTLVVDGVTDPAEITQALAAAGHYVSELTPVRADLESVFLDLTASTTLGTPSLHPEAEEAR